MRAQKLADLYVIPTDSRGNQTTAKGELEPLYERTGDMVFWRVLQIRSLDTNLRNYLPNWKPGPDGKVHTTFTFGPPTGQIASRQPNVQNLSKWTELGQEFRKIIVAPAGYTWVEFDFARFHVNTMAYCAKDPMYLKFAQRDCHAIFGSWMVPDFPDISLTWSNDEIDLAAKELKAKFPIARQKAKAPVLGNQLGLGKRKLFWQNRKSPAKPWGLESENEAGKLQQLLADRFPKEEIFKREIRERAHAQNYLIDEWGTIRYFHEVFTWRFNKKRQDWEEKPGSQFNEAVAQFVQSRAHGLLKWVNLNMIDKLERYGFINTIHDSNFFLCETAKLGNCIADVKPHMEQPCPVLKNEVCPEGLAVKVDVKVGKNWSDYHPTNNEDGLREIKC